MKRSETQAARLRTALQKVVLLRETGPKSAAWHRARIQTIWHIHALMDKLKNQTDSEDDNSSSC
jgi:predicted cupin superfamily sugar epimerase